MKINAQFSLEKIQHNKSNDLHLVVSLKAPAIDWQKRRSPICIIPVIDCSQSMGSAGKMEYAKQSVLKLIDHLQPGDYMGIVGFSSEPFLVSAPVEITQAQKDLLKGKVGELKPDSWTNFSGGMLLGLEQGNKTDLPSGTQVRIVMFTDGQANRGSAVKPEDIVKLLKATKGGCSVSAFGYGADAQQDMLSDVSRMGDGNYAFIKAPEDALAAFGRELGGLLSTYATNIKIELFPHNGHRVTEVLSDVDVEEDEKAGTVAIKLADILAEETRNLVFAVKTSEQKQPLPRDVNLFDVKISYDTVDENGKKHSETKELKAKLRFVKDGEQQDKPIKAVDEIVALAQLAKAQIEAEKLANHGNYQQAYAVMNFMAADLNTRGLENYSANVVKMADKMSNAAVYASSAGYRMSVKKSVTRGQSASTSDPEAMADLGVYNCVVSNDAQEATASSFTSSAPVVAVAPVNSQDVSQIVSQLPVVPPSVETKGGVTKNKSGRW